MKSYKLTAGQDIGYPHKHPDRTARRRASRGLLDFDVVCQIWPSREAMARAIRKQNRNRVLGEGTLDWRPIVPLADGEGY